MIDMSKQIQVVISKQGVLPQYKQAVRINPHCIPQRLRGSGSR